MRIADRAIGADAPTYFVADIAASHDGELSRAIDLIHLAAEAGADAAKFQNFSAGEIVSDRGFRELGGRLSHQAAWKKSVFQVYEDASIPHSWTPELKRACDEAGIHYFSAAYDVDAIDMLEPYVPAYKIGSGDISWLEMVEYTAGKGKPVLMATGASSLADVIAAVDAVCAHTDDLVLMQCNTNYTASHDNFAHINLNVLRTYATLFPNVVLGLSDHTPGHTTVLGAIALGARVIEKHFTDDTERPGPDHKFSMDPRTWREMVDRSRELESALGSPVKRVAGNEKETVVIQRRGLRAKRGLPAGHVVTRDDLTVLRPATPGGFTADQLDLVVGSRLRVALDEAALIRYDDVDRKA
jgi:N-acetylneuraminate synthase